MKTGKILNKNTFLHQIVVKVCHGGGGQKLFPKETCAEVKCRYFASDQHSAERYPTRNVLIPSTLRIPCSPPGS